MRLNAAVLALWAGLFVGGDERGALAPDPGTYWQDRACDRSYGFCVDRIRIGEDGRMEVGCLWRGDGSRKASDAGNREIYLLDEAGRRYDHVAATDAAAYGSAGTRMPYDAVRGGFLFPGPRDGARRFTLRDDTRGRVVERIELDVTRRSSIDASRALLGRVLEADSIEIRDTWGGLGPGRDRRIVLTREGQAFAGEVSEVRSHRGRWTREPEPTRPLRLEPPQARRFLSTLVESALTAGEYRPNFVLDSYPNVAITIAAGNERFAFTTRSVGEFHVPWECAAGGRRFVVPSDHPGRALFIVRALLGGERPPRPPSPEAGPPVDTSDLRLAAQLGDVARVTSLLAGGADARRRTTYDGETALTAAARWGQAGSVKALLDAGADPSVPNASGQTALTLASEGGHADIVKLLQDRRGNASTVDLGALLKAAQAESVESVRALLGNRRIDGPEAGRAVVEAALTNSPEMIRLLLAAGAPLDTPNGEGLRPLEAAITHGHLEATQALIAAGADVRRVDRGKWTPLHHAAIAGHADVVEALLRAGADPNAAREDGATPLFLARAPGAAQALLRGGARPDARRNDRATVLLATTEYLQGTIAYTNHKRREPASADVPGVARVLLDAGADIEAEDAEGRTALQRALTKPLVEHNLPLAIVLVEHGADPKRRDREGRTPLGRAAGYYLEFRDGLGPARATPLIEALLKAGARDVPDAAGVKSIDLARSLNVTALVTMLEAPRR